MHRSLYQTRRNSKWNLVQSNMEPGFINGISLQTTSESTRTTCLAQGSGTRLRCRISTRCDMIIAHTGTKRLQDLHTRIQPIGEGQSGPIASQSVDKKTLPGIFVAPMEVLGDYQLRAGLAALGGMDCFITEFLRVPETPNMGMKGVSARYDKMETRPYPIIPQVMGAANDNMVDMVKWLIRRGANHINLNAGCPAKKVTSKCAGSSLLKEPAALHEVVSLLVNTARDFAQSTPRTEHTTHSLNHNHLAHHLMNISTHASYVPHITVKMRTGFTDTSLFEENVWAAVEAGASALFIHGRTKEQRYQGSADWSLVRRAKELVSQSAQYQHVRIIGNGDIVSADDATRMVEETKCDGVMIGRGAVLDPFIFQEVQAAFCGEAVPGDFRSDDQIVAFWTALAVVGRAKNQNAAISKLKMIVSWYFSHPLRRVFRQHLLTRNPTTESEYIYEIVQFAKMAEVAVRQQQVTRSDIIRTMNVCK